MLFYVTFCLKKVFYGCPKSQKSVGAEPNSSSGFHKFTGKFKNQRFTKTSETARRVKVAEQLKARHAAARSNSQSDTVVNVEQGTPQNESKGYTHLRDVFKYPIPCMLPSFPFWSSFQIVLLTCSVFLSFSIFFRCV